MYYIRFEIRRKLYTVDTLYLRNYALTICLAETFLRSENYCIIGFALAISRLRNSCWWITSFVTILAVCRHRRCDSNLRWMISCMLWVVPAIFGIRARASRHTVFEKLWFDFVRSVVRRTGTFISAVRRVEAVCRRYLCTHSLLRYLLRYVGTILAVPVSNSFVASSGQLLAVTVWNSIVALFIYSFVCCIQWDYDTPWSEIRSDDYEFYVVDVTLWCEIRLTNTSCIPKKRIAQDVHWCRRVVNTNACFRYYEFWLG